MYCFYTNPTVASSKIVDNDAPICSYSRRGYPSKFSNQYHTVNRYSAAL